MIVFAFCIVTLLILLVAFYEWQHFMVFTPTYFRNQENDVRYEFVSIQTDDGVWLEGVVYEPHAEGEKTAVATLLFFAGRSHDSVGLIHKLSQSFPYTRVITFNYRSYGKSGGVVSEKNIRSDGQLIAQRVQKNYGDFYVLGFSIGSCVAAFIASKQKVLGLFLVGSFDSLASLSRKKVILRYPWLLRYTFDNTKLVQNVDAKTYVFASKADDVTFIQNARNLKNHVKNLTLYQELEGLHHKELLWDNRVIDEIKKGMV